MRGVDPRTVACPQCGQPEGAFCEGKAKQVIDYHRLRRSVARAAAERDAARAEEDPVTAEVLPSREEYAARLLVLKALLERVTSALSAEREAATAAWRIGDNVSGYLTPDDAEEGLTLGRVGMSKPSETWSIKDVDAFTEWVQAVVPTEIEQRPIVRNSFITSLLAKCKADGGWTDKASGECIIPPGVELTKGKAGLTVSVAKGAGDLIADAMAAGRIRMDGDGVLAITAGEIT